MNLQQMELRCPDSEVIGTVRLEGYRLSFAGGSGVATILPCPGSYVDGVLWKISKADECELDRYEGYPRLYGKEKVTVQDERGKKHSVMAYTMNAPYRDDVSLPSSPYLYGILAGCKQNGIDPGAVYEAYDETVNKLAASRGTQSKQNARKEPRRSRKELER